MKTIEEVRDKLAGARGMYADCLRAAREIQTPEIVAEAAKFYASLRVLEWVLDKDEGIR